MSIVPLVRATVLGLEGDAPGLLDRLQTLGVMHVVRLGQPPASVVPAPALPPDAEQAIRILAHTPSRRRQVGPRAPFEASEVVRQVLEVQERLDSLVFERDHLQARIETIAPWGDFRLPPLEQLGGNRLWFYIVPGWQVGSLPGGLPWEVVHRHSGQAYVVVVHPDEPTGIPVPRSHVGPVPLSALRERLEQAELALEEARAERVALTRWLTRLRAYRDAHRDTRSRQEALDKALVRDGVLALQGWVPEPALADLRRLTDELGLALIVEEPRPEDEPPTLLANPEVLAGGEEIVHFYSLPGYRSADPSVPLFFSFAIFFAMITSDAGYGLLLAVVVGVASRWLGQTRSGRRLRLLAWVIVVASVVYGALVGSWFGLTPAWAQPLAVLDATDSESMMALCIGIGLVHVVLGNLQEAWARRGRWHALGPIGWVLGLLGGAGAALAATGALSLPLVGPIALAGFGGGLVLVFTDPSPFPPRTLGAALRRLGQGVGRLFSVSQAFGDVMSYLRLFALGLASASLAATFNGLASQIFDLFPGVGFVLAAAVLLVGHGVNLALGIVGGVVHGLRLNVIEYYHWAVTEEGTAFAPLRRTEEGPWTSSS